MKAVLRTLRYLLILVGGSSPAFAGARHFTYVYEAVPTAPGGVEIENWMTLNDDRTVSFRHELEFGVTRHFQAAVYVADWTYHDQSNDRPSGFSYEASALELIYNFTNPVADPVGISIYQESRIGDRVFESESKLIAQKNFGPWILAYNATLEAAWHGQDLEEREGELQQVLGVSYEFTPRFSVGGEVVFEIVFPDWAGKREMNLLAGPNASFRAGSWWTTVTALAVATGDESEPALQVRAIVGHNF